MNSTQHKFKLIEPNINIKYRIENKKSDKIVQKLKTNMPTYEVSERETNVVNLPQDQIRAV